MSVAVIRQTSFSTRGKRLTLPRPSERVGGERGHPVDTTTRALSIPATAVPVGRAVSWRSSTTEQPIRFVVVRKAERRRVERRGTFLPVALLFGLFGMAIAEAIFGAHYAPYGFLMAAMGSLLFVSLSLVRRERRARRGEP
jgi:hypothetical protein